MSYDLTNDQLAVFKRTNKNRAAVRFGLLARRIYDDYRKHTKLFDSPRDFRRAVAEYTQIPLPSVNRLFRVGEIFNDQPELYNALQSQGLLGESNLIQRVALKRFTPEQRLRELKARFGIWKEAAERRAKKAHVHAGTVASNGPIDSLSSARKGVVEPLKSFLDQDPVKQRVQKVSSKSAANALTSDDVKHALDILVQHSIKLGEASMFLVKAMEDLRQDTKQTKKELEEFRRQFTGASAVSVGSLGTVIPRLSPENAGISAKGIAEKLNLESSQPSGPKLPFFVQYTHVRGVAAALHIIGDPEYGLWCRHADETVGTRSAHWRFNDRGRDKIVACFREFAERVQPRLNEYARKNLDYAKQRKESLRLFQVGLENMKPEGTSPVLGLTMTLDDLWTNKQSIASKYTNGKSALPVQHPRS